MATRPNLTTVPEEILYYIGKYLCPHDLLATSAACRNLRSVFNVNSLWWKFTDEGVGQALDNIVSLVPPKFKNLDNISTLEPLCEHRQLFLKQSRLMNNWRNGTFIEHSITFSGYISDFETSRRLDNRQITCNNLLFTLDYGKEVEVIKVFNIEKSIELMDTVPIKQVPRRYYVVISCQVIGNKLILRRDDWFDIYEIKVAEPLKILFTINICTYNGQQLNHVLVINHYLFVENFTLNAMHVWDLESGNQLEDILPKINSPFFTVLGYSRNHEFIIFSVGRPNDGRAIPYLFVYSIKSFEFTSFCYVINETVFSDEMCGYINHSNVVLLCSNSNRKCSAFVFDLNTSKIIVHRSNILKKDIGNGSIINDFLVLPSLTSILVMDLNNLETVWEIQLDSGNLLYEIPEEVYIEVQFICISSLCNLIIVSSSSRTQIWEFEKQRKLFDLPLYGSVAISNTYSKLIFCGSEKLRTFSFW